MSTSAKGQSHVIDAERTPTLFTTVLSESYQINQIYRSMEGPKSTQEVYILRSNEPELLWVTGFTTEMVDINGHSIESNEYMCHSNLDFTMSGMNLRHGSNRAFTVSQGQLDIQFPDGFGIPVRSDLPFSLATQVLNLNQERIDIRVRHKVKVNFMLDRILQKQMTPLMAISAFAVKALNEGDQYFDIADPNSDIHGQGCLVGEEANPRVLKDKNGRRFTGHWIVPPGREVNHTNVTEIMSLPFDATVHYIAVHLHPFAEYLELLDLTDGVSVFKSFAYPQKDRIGLSKVDDYSSREGIQLYKDHQYQLISVYNNTSEKDQDAMAVMYLYIQDNEFVDPFGNTD